MGIVSLRYTADNLCSGRGHHPVVGRGRESPPFPRPHQSHSSRERRKHNHNGLTKFAVQAQCRQHVSLCSRSREHQPTTTSTTTTNTAVQRSRGLRPFPPGGRRGALSGFPHTTGRQQLLSRSYREGRRCGRAQPPLLECCTQRSCGTTLTMHAFIVHQHVHARQKKVWREGVCTHVTRSNTQ